MESELPPEPNSANKGRSMIALDDDDDDEVLRYEENKLNKQQFIFAAILSFR